MTDVAEDPPLVSIGLPVFNGAGFLAQSVETLLAQSYPNLELIISDNASTDGTAGICALFASRDKRVRYSRLDRNVGGTPNHQRVFDLATGRYFMWASHDDLWDAHYVEECVKCLEEDSGAVLAYSKMALIDQHGKILRLFELPTAANSPMVAERFQECIDIYAMLESCYGVIRTDVLRRMHRLILHPGHDKILLGELSLHGRFRRVDKHLYMRRIHDDRSVTVFPGIRERYAWAATALAGKRVFPHLAYLREFARAILRAPLSATETISCGVALLRWSKENWKELAGDLGLRSR